MIETKLIFVAVVLTAGLSGGAIALWRRSSLSASSKLGLGNAFAAGVFLSVGLIHMLPHAAETCMASSRQAGFLAQEVQAETTGNL